MSTIAELFFAEGKAPADQGSKILEAAEELAAQEAVKQLGQALPRWSPAIRDVEQGLRETLGVSIQDVLLGAWTKYGVLREYTDPTKHPPGERSTYTVGKHSISSQYHPKLELRLNGRTLGTLTFDVELSLAFEIGQLLIRDGRIFEIKAGDAVARGTVKLGKKELAKCESKPFHLPATITVAEGIPIPH